MKKLKILFLAIAFILCFSYAVPLFSGFKNITSATPETSGFSYIQVENFVDEANVGGSYYIRANNPLSQTDIPHATLVTVGTGEDDTKIKIEVKSPFGESLGTLYYDNGTSAYVNTGNVLHDVDGYYVNVNTVGSYQLIYSYTDTGMGLVSQPLYFTAKEGMYYFEFEKNLSQIIPAYIDTDTSSESRKIILPNPYVKNEDGTEAVNPEDVDYFDFVEVRVFRSYGNPATIEEIVDPDLVIVEGHYEFTVDEAGSWTIEYRYMSGSRILETTTKTIMAGADYVTDYELSFVYDSTPPATAITGVSVTLPTVSGKDENGNPVEIYYEISAQKINYNPETGLPESPTPVNSSAFDGNEFTPPEDGDYIITYTVNDFYGHTKSANFPIDDVVDTKVPVARLVNPYDISPALVIPPEDEDASYDLPSKWGTSNIILPAIWADDNVSITLDSNPTDEIYDGLILTRKIVRTNGTVIYEGTSNPNKQLVFNLDGLTLNEGQVEVTSEDLEEGVSFNAGTYNVTYIAKDAAGNISQSVTYRLVLEQGYVDSIDPVVSWSTAEPLPSQIIPGDKIHFLSPTATDVHERNRIVVSHRFGTTGDWEILVLENGAYEIEIEENTIETELQIKATATDAHGNIGEITKIIEIINIDDSEPTTIFSYDDDPIVGYVPDGEDPGEDPDPVYNNYTQGQEITLPTMVYEDDFISFVNVEYFVTSGEIEFAVNGMTYGDIYPWSDQLTISSAKFYASVAGDYIIAIVSKDIDNNHTIFFHKINITPFAETPEIGFASLPSSINGGTVELGQTITLPVATITGAEGNITWYNIRVIGSGATASKEFGFNATKVGTYQIEYYGAVWIDFLNGVYDSDEVIIEDYNENSIYELGLAEPFEDTLIVNGVYDEGEPFTDWNGNSVYDADLDEFIDGNGIVDSNDTKVTDSDISKIFTIEVVDTTKPVISIHDYVQPIVAVGYELDIPQFSATDLSEIDEDNSKVVLSSKSFGTRTIKYGDIEANRSFELNYNELYTLTFTVKDIYGNTATLTKSIEVGDIVDPTISIADTTENPFIPQNVKVGDTLTLDLAKITLLDNFSVLENEDLVIVVKRDGATIENIYGEDKTRYAYNIEQSGEYTVKLTVTDDVGRSTTETRTFTVTADTNEGVDHNQIIGTVLIVVSVLILASVIVYFIVSKKKAGKDF